MMLQSMYYILNEQNTPIPCKDVLTWAKWHDRHKRESRLHAVTHIDDIEISTKFFGTDLLGKHCLWETMVFRGEIPDHAFTSRTMTLSEAQEKHRMTVERVNNEHTAIFE